MKRGLLATRISKVNDESSTTFQGRANYVHQRAACGLALFLQWLPVSRLPLGLRLALCRIVACHVCFHATDNY